MTYKDHGHLRNLTLEVNNKIIKASEVQMWKDDLDMHANTGIRVLTPTRIVN